MGRSSPPKRARQKHLGSRLSAQTLLAQSAKRATEGRTVRMLPEATIVQIGGRLIDGGIESIGPVIGELVPALGSAPLIIAAGQGERTGHVVRIATDLGLPAGVNARLAQVDAEQNAIMLAAFLAPYGVISLPHEQLVHMLPAWLKVAGSLVWGAVPPYSLWEHVPFRGEEPPTGADLGVLLLADTYGMRAPLYLRRWEGSITAAGSRETLEAAGVDPAVLDLLARTRLVREIRLINVAERGQFARALAGDVKAGLAVSSG